MREEKTNTLRKVNGKKLGIIGAVLIILIAFIIGISIYNTPENRLLRQIDLGQRYLEEQNYEQAIVEFDKANAIDPMNADAYLGKAQAYEGMGDREKALETLWAGYERTGDEEIEKAVCSYLESDIEKLIAEGRYDEAEALIEQYRDKVQGVDFQKYLDEIAELKTAAEIEELLENIPSFDLSDIKVMGYDLLGPRLEEIVGALGYAGIPDADGYIESQLPDGTREYISNDEIILYVSTGGGAWYYNENDEGNNLHINKVNRVETNASQIGMSRSDMPISLGDSYEKWCDLLGVDLLKESPLVEEGERSSSGESAAMNYTQQTYRISGGDTTISYLEQTYETVVKDESTVLPFYDYDMTADLQINLEGENVDVVWITASFLDGTVQSIGYSFRW